MSSSDTSPRDRHDDDRAADADGASAPEAICPFCGSADSELHSTFGSEVSKSQYYCNGCHTVFERIKYDGAMPPTGRERDDPR